ncbi:putative transmembrane protein [Halotydeus destructor]|nr:putative transmembrane protein [Halotydeus destructor]
MTNYFSKLFRSVDYNCYEVIHTWNPSCWSAFGEFVMSSIKGALWIYTPLYFGPHLLTRNFSTQALETTARRFVRSLFAVTGNTSLILLFSCAIMKMTGKVHYLTPFFGSMLSHFCSFWFERESRRNALALFSSKSAFEICFQYLKANGHLNGFNEQRAAILLFAASVSVNLYLARLKGFSKDPLSQLLALIVGRQEGKTIPKTPVENADNGDEDGQCPHRDPCVQYALTGFVKPFLVGWLGQVGLTLLKKRRDLWSLLLDRNALKLGVFLGGMSLVFRGSQCTLRTATGTNGAENSLLSGLLAGLAGSSVYPSTQIALYCFWKTVYTLYWAHFQGSHRAQQFVDLIFFICDSILINCTIMEPQYVAKSYLNFVDSVTNKKLRVVNVSLYNQLTDKTNEWHYGDRVQHLDSSFVTPRYLHTTGLWLLGNKHNFTK